MSDNVSNIPDATQVFSLTKNEAMINLSWESMERVVFAEVD
jgi:hypothetical protein